MLWALALVDLVDDGLRDLAHAQAAVHRGLLDPAERLRLRQAHLGGQQALGALDQLAGGELLLQVADLALQGLDLFVPGEGDLKGGDQVRGGERRSAARRGRCGP